MSKVCSPWNSRAEKLNLAHAVMRTNNNGGLYRGSQAALIRLRRSKPFPQRVMFGGELRSTPSGLDRVSPQVFADELAAFG